MKRLILSVGTVVLALGFCGVAVVHEWRTGVPANERVRTNPYPRDAATLASGAKIYAERCAKCHGSDATGRGRRPSLRTARVQEATDGELLWLLRNGDLRDGMPGWSGLPEEQRWQVERYIKSLPAN
jgi:mono/diheme cytochrome c family protein